MHKRSYLFAEFFCLFVCLPFAIKFFHIQRYFLPVLWIFAYICYNILKKDPSFDQQNWKRKEVITGKNFKHILTIFVLATIPLTLYTYFFEHDKFLSFPLQNTILWALVMVLYPVLSVYPQEVIYRAYLSHRYKSIFKNEKIILAISAVAFGYAHIIFSNFIAVFLCCLGGILFGLNYRKNKSILLVSMEHGLYGCMIFTIGLGWYFFHGAVH